MDNFKYIQEKVNSLENEVHGKNLELSLIQSELSNTVLPYQIQSEIIGITIEMISEYIEYSKKNGDSELNKYRRNRLIKLNELIDKLSSTISTNHQLKLMNRQIHSNYQLLRVKYMDLLNQFNKMKNAENF